MFERVVSIVGGTALIGAVIFLVSKPARSAQTIRDYYAQQVARETARGWLGKPLLGSGKLAPWIVLLLLLTLMLTIGIYFIYSGVMG